MVRALFLALLLWHTAGPLSAQASDDFDPQPSPEFLARAMETADWVVRNSDYDGYQHLPALVKLPRATLNYMVYSQTTEGYNKQEDINALYVPHAILISDEFEWDSGSHTLVHEMVHHFQFETGKQFRCTQEAEHEAYELQAKWVEETGLGELPSLLFILRLKCDNPHDYSR